MNTLTGLVLTLSMSLNATAAETGRYQALPLGSETARNSPRTLIIDSRDGHLWLWGENEALIDENGARRYGTAIIYQGRLRPGSKAGEIVVP